jgi:hypothetical protein
MSKSEVFALNVETDKYSPDEEENYGYEGDAADEFSPDKIETGF